MFARLLTRNLPYKIHKGFTRYKSQPAIIKAVPDEGSNELAFLKPGTKVHGFEVTKTDLIPEFNINSVLLQHERTKAEYLHLYRNDSNNVFAVMFRTTPMNSTGLPHILEHIVLCGSKKFPVRDPFFKMLNRSLATFMNALTGSDYTMYPFSTQNYTDFCNLQKIYLDAALQPNLNEMDFRQEGWRLENENPNDKESKLVIKGVVYNEMKGVYSENDNIFMQNLQNLILPDHTYGVVSGGDPLQIPNLTWDDLKAFHKRYYHPSNSRIFSYGNFPIIPSLEYLDGEYLSKYSLEEPNHTVVPPQPRWQEPKTYEITCRYDTMAEPFEKQNTVSISYLMCDITNVYESFLLNFITELLVKGPSAPLYKSLIEPNFSSGFTNSTGFDASIRDTIFSVGLTGIKKNDFDRFIKTYHSTIDEVIAKGFESRHIESVLHRYELAIKHETNNFGLHLLFGLSAIWNHNGDVLNSLKVNSLIKKLRGEMDANPNYLQDVVQKYFKENNHRMILSMCPDNEYEKKQIQLEADLLKEKTRKLSSEDKDVIYEKGLQLLKEQSTEPNKSLLPSLQINDISEDVEKIHIEKIKSRSISTQINQVNTNEITYFKGILNTGELSSEQQMLLPLLCYVVTKLGTDKMNYIDFDNLASRKTSGLNLSVHIGESLFQLNSYEPGILLRSYCLDQNVDTMWDLWTQIFTLSKLRDVKRFQMLVQLYMSNVTHGIADSGHVYAMQAASGLVSGTGYQKELLTGLNHISYMKQLIRTASYEAMLNELSAIIRAIFDKNKLRCALNVCESSKKNIINQYDTFLDGLPGNMLGTTNENAYCTKKVWTPTDEINCQHHVLNVPVYFCSKSILTVPYSHPDHAKLRLLTRILFSKYLHGELREKQGAYGAGATINREGVFLFYTYRDPKHLDTLEVFDKTGEWMMKELVNVSEQDLLEAKLGVFKDVDAPIPPGEKGMREFLYGITPDVLQRHRAEIMTANLNSLMEVAEKYFVKSDCLTGKVILGPKNIDFDTSSREKELWTVLENE